MKRLSSSERLVVRPALSNLADYLRRQIDSVAALAETDVGQKLVSVYGYECVHLFDTRDFLRQIARPNFVRKEFRHAYEALRGCGRSTEANELHRLYGNSSEHAMQTLQYVEVLLVDLDPEEIRRA